MSTDHLNTMKCKEICLIFGILLITLSGCSTQPSTPSYADIAAQYEAMKQETPERVIFDFDPACNDEGMCYVEESRLNKAAQIITELNTAYQKAVEAANTRLDAIAHCEYSGAQKDAAITALEQGMDKQSLIHQIKQIVTFAGCGLLLGTQ